jgi:hypothetical protein
VSCFGRCVKATSVLPLHAGPPPSRTGCARWGPWGTGRPGPLAPLVRKPRVGGQQGVRWLNLPLPLLTPVASWTPPGCLAPTIARRIVSLTALRPDSVKRMRAAPCDVFTVVNACLCASSSSPLRHHLHQQPATLHLLVTTMRAASRQPHCLNQLPRCSGCHTLSASVGTHTRRRAVAADRHCQAWRGLRGAEQLQRCAGLAPVAGRAQPGARGAIAACMHACVRERDYFPTPPHNCPTGQRMR